MRLTAYGRYIDFGLKSLRWNVRFGSKADVCDAITDLLVRESSFRRRVWKNKSSKNLAAHSSTSFCRLLRLAPYSERTFKRIAFLQDSGWECLCKQKSLLQQDLPVVGFANSGSAQAQALMLGANPRGCRFCRGQERPDRVPLGRRSIRCGHFAPTQRICAETAVLVSLGPTLDRRPRLHPKE